MYTNKEKKKDLERSRQIEEAQINFMDESRKVEELSGHYDKTVKLIQKELKATRQSLRDLEIESEQRAHEVERLQAELELKST
jgi:NAD+--asparagine ADP-ribosyltransferase